MSVPGSTSVGASFECSLLGTVHPGQFRHLYDRLLGICEHAAHAKMFEHELLFTPAIQRPIYAARNDEVHLRLRVKLTVLDQPDQEIAQQQQDTLLENARKRLKEENHSNHDRQLSMGGSKPNTTVTAGGDDTEMEDPSVATTNVGQENSDPPLSTPITDSMAGIDLAKMTDPSLQPQEDPLDTERRHILPRNLFVSRQYQLCQYGHPEPGKSVVVRSAILVKIHGDAFGFLQLLGYGMEEEYVRRGYSFMYNNICRISVFRKYKLSKQHDPFSVIVPENETINSPDSSWMVEITSCFVSQENVNSMSEEINAVRNLLTGSVAF
ncbi:hypothetical protein BGW38_009281 [Lunasporangiospora selenospora]|uniref:Mediator of RNA polymerase II transcription subunit 18 n=1 Tax=Lunasporangiospora selenospora TaxID=979761 RepID=A0A9P6KG09_9FUNG|nr:hypothetical protein BGW38_009281 [Lunasporangiospora selenospora]